MEKWDLKNHAILCNSWEEAKSCFLLAESMGFTWFNGDKYSKFGCWSAENPCYDFYNGRQGSVEHFKGFNYDIESSSWFLDNFLNIKKMKRLPRKIKKLAKNCIFYGDSEYYNHDDYDYWKIIHNYPKGGVLFICLKHRKPYERRVILFGKKIRFSCKEGMLDF